MRPVYVELEQGLVDQLEALAERNRRTLKAEITIALEKHVGSEHLVPPPAPARVPEEERPQDPAALLDQDQPELPTTRGRFLILLGEPHLRGRPRWVHFSWRNESFCIRDFLTGAIRRQDTFLQAADVWRAALKRVPAVGEYFHPVGDWDWWRSKLEELSRE